MSKKITLFILLFIVCLLPLGFASIACLNTDVNESSATIFCFYISGNNYEILSPQISSDKGISFELVTKPISAQPNTKYLFKIGIDVLNSKEGEHTLKIKQGSEIYPLKVNLKRETQDINYKVEISYPSGLTQTIKAVVKLTNLTKKTYPSILKAIEVPEGIEVNLEKEIISLSAGSTKEISNIIEYDKPLSGTLYYTLNYGTKKETIAIDLEKDKMPIAYNSNNITALFSLADTKNSNTLFIILDICLFICAVVLFTMFIGRLGKYIVKK